MKKKISGVYKIVNRINGKVYVGSSIDMKRRSYNHKNKLKNNKHHNQYLQHSVNKYGIEAFEFKIIERCDPSITFERERYWMEYTGANNPEYGYNLKVIADTSKFTWSDEAKKEMSDNWTEERKQIKSEQATRQHDDNEYYIFNIKDVRQYKVIKRSKLLKSISSKKLSIVLQSSNKIKESYIFYKDSFTGCRLIERITRDQPYNNDDQCIQVYVFNLSSILANTYKSQAEAAKELNVSRSAIYKSIRYNTKVNRKYYISTNPNFIAPKRSPRKRHGGRKKRSVSFDGHVYNTIEQASNKLNIPIPTLYSKLHNSNESACYIN